jgi:hypothetical protein
LYYCLSGRPAPGKPRGGATWGPTGAVGDRTLIRSSHAPATCSEDPAQHARAGTTILAVADAMNISRKSAFVHLPTRAPHCATSLSRHHLHTTRHGAAEALTTIARPASVRTR